MGIFCLERHGEDFDMSVDISQDQLHQIKLWYLVQHSLSSFRKLIGHFGSAELAVQSKNLALWKNLNIHESHKKRVAVYQTASGQVQFEKTIDKLQLCCDQVLTECDTYYPQQLLTYADRPPILFIKGQWQILNQPQVAIVGSRKPSAHGKQVAYDFAYYLSDKGFYIVSGLAQGIDEAAHLGAIQQQRTLAVIGTGLDLVYPPQNKKLQALILEASGCIVSEFLPGTPALQHHFPRRNRIVSGLSLAVLVAEATLKSGSLITAKCAAEQGKMTFAIPGHIYSDFHQGCHQLIREGAILVDHPEQMVEDLALPTQWLHQQHKQQHQSIELHTTAAESRDKPDIHSQLRHEQKLNVLEQRPEHHLADHLRQIYQQLDWEGKDIDQLSNQLKISVAELTAYLVDLELLGLCMQQYGRYLRCRVSH